MNKYLIIVILVLLGIIAVGGLELRKSNKRWEAAEANVKAYDSQLGYEKKKSAAFQLTAEQLKYFNDSILQALDKTREELGIKDKHLKALQAVKSGFTKRDTVRLPGDTIFKEPSFSLDTLIGDQWYNLQLGLKYPSMVAVKPYFKSEKHIVVSCKKETVNPPKKFFLFRWFQKKHRVLHVDVVEKNPYVDEEVSKYIEIIK